MPILHDHRRRVPTQDHLCRIDVGVFKVAAAGTDKTRLVLATSTINCNTLRASLARVAGGNLHKFTTPFFQFVFQ